MVSIVRRSGVRAANWDDCAGCGGQVSTAWCWLLPYPAGGKAPHQILQKLPTLQGTPNFSWMPDGRHIVVALTADGNSPNCGIFPSFWLCLGRFTGQMNPRTPE